MKKRIRKMSETLYTRAWQGSLTLTRTAKLTLRARGRWAGAILLMLAALALGSVSTAHAYVYWANGGSDSIGRANLDGTGVDQTFLPTDDAPIGIAVNGAFLYWSNSVANAIGR